MIIDFHTHVFPDKMAGMVLEKLSKSSDVEYHTDGTIKGLKKSMEENGVGVSVTLPVATSPDQIPTINQFASTYLSEKGLIPFGSIHPEFKKWKEELARIKDIGMRGIKIHPDYQDTFFDDGRYVDIMRECGRLELTVVTHAGVDRAFRESVHCTPQMIAETLPAIGETKLVAAHFGGYLMADDVLKHLVGRDVYLDTSFSYEDEPELCGEIVRKHRVDRLLFASDSPWRDLKGAIGFIDGLNLDPVRRSKLFSVNAGRLLFLSGSVCACKF